MTVGRVAIAALLLGISLTACDRGTIEGRVTNMRGEALPGVTVRVAGSGDQDLTDGLGRYRVAARAGAARLVYSKTGYTTAELPVQASSRGVMPDTVLWILPMNPGVYAVNDLRFIETTWAVPKQYYLKDKTQAYGVELSGELVEAVGEPFIVTHKTPRYNAKLSRLLADEASIQGLDETSIKVWVEAGTMAAALVTIDAPEGRLQRVQVGRPLEPGVYGVHWGALEGYTTLDNRVYLFRIPEPPPQEEAPADAAEPPEPEQPAEEDDAAGIEPSSADAPARELLEPSDEITPPA